jgi:hypothetical protein
MTTLNIFDGGKMSVPDVRRISKEEFDKYFGYIYQVTFEPYTKYEPSSYEEWTVFHMAQEPGKFWITDTPLDEEGERARDYQANDLIYTYDKTYQGALRVGRYVGDKADHGTDRIMCKIIESIDQVYPK